MYILEKDDEQARLDREEKKRYLLRKLSFRPSVDELKNRKVSYHIINMIHLLNNNVFSDY